MCCYRIYEGNASRGDASSDDEIAWRLIAFFDLVLPHNLFIRRSVSSSSTPPSPSDVRELVEVEMRHRAEGLHVMALIASAVESPSHKVCAVFF